MVSWLKAKYCYPGTDHMLSFALGMSIADGDKKLRTGLCKGEVKGPVPITGKHDIDKEITFRSLH